MRHPFRAASLRAPSLLVPALLLAACGAPPAPEPPPPASGAAYDVVIEGGSIVDGTGNAWYPGDVGIRGDRIAAITHPGIRFPRK